MAEVTMTLEEYQDLEDKLSTLAKENHNLKEERDDFREQRDELINDIADIKRKAEAFDEIVNAVDESANSYELVARIKLEVLNYQKLEREEL
ncbi:hypothetical protein BUY45_06150 [Staphylococcus devriesei]|uniref:hypothetical protein n=1 Tax=Staphylococcus devriesei TaxID=586733 RepID=UPI000D1CCA71|nr:hypothetical protein [Staphylococcus devriesei]PTF03964.1 hypothetical protein BUY45_06150 [Staphylococcus devriesei]RIO91538.1 hypothetical protein BUZ39_06620 [Staphylococcus haemolyticus]